MNDEFFDYIDWLWYQWETGTFAPIYDENPNWEENLTEPSPDELALMNKCAEELLLDFIDNEKFSL